MLYVKFAVKVLWFMPTIFQRTTVQLNRSNLIFFRDHIETCLLVITSRVWTNNKTTVFLITLLLTTTFASLARTKQ